MTPDPRFHPATPHGPQADREQTWRALQARLGRVERVIETLLADIQRRAAVTGPHHRLVAPTQLELVRLEAARRLREDIEGAMQGFLDETRCATVTSTRRA